MLESSSKAYFEDCQVGEKKVLDTQRGLLAIYNLIKNHRREIVVSFTGKVLVGRRPSHETHQPVGPRMPVSARIVRGIGPSMSCGAVVK